MKLLLFLSLILLVGASGGQAGMHDLLRSLPRPIDAVIEIGDLAGDPGDHRVVVGWSASGRFTKGVRTTAQAPPGDLAVGGVGVQPVP